MYKIAVLGDVDSIYGFKALGLEIFICNDPDEAISCIKKLALDEYAIIYITKSLARKISNNILSYYERQLPAIVLIPDASKSADVEALSLKKLVKKAVGSNAFYEY